MQTTYILATQSIMSTCLMSIEAQLVSSMVSLHAVVGISFRPTPLLTVLQWLLITLRIKCQVLTVTPLAPVSCPCLTVRCLDQFSPPRLSHAIHSWCLHMPFFPPLQLLVPLSTIPVLPLRVSSQMTVLQRSLPQILIPPH